MKFFEKYKNLIIFVLLTLIIFVIGFFTKYSFCDLKNTKESFWNILWEVCSVLDTATAIALAVLAFLAYVEYARNEDEIELKIAIYEKGNYDKAKEIIDFCILAGDKIKILRKEVTRGEILGLLGMFQKNTGNRYNLSDNKLILILLDEVKKVQKAKKNECIIPILKEDYDKYFNPAIPIKKEEKNQ